MPREGGGSLISAASVGMAVPEGQQNPDKKRRQNECRRRTTRIEFFVCVCASKMCAESEEASALWNGRES